METAAALKREGLDPETTQLPEEKASAMPDSAHTPWKWLWARSSAGEARTKRATSSCRKLPLLPRIDLLKTSSISRYESARDRDRSKRTPCPAKAKSRFRRGFTMENTARAGTLWMARPSKSSTLVSWNREAGPDFKSAVIRFEKAGK
jgi:hypothetical protein